MANLPKVPTWPDTTKGGTMKPESFGGSAPSEGGKSPDALPIVAKHPMMGPEYFGGTYTESCPDGDNPSISESADLPVQGDLRNRDTQRGSNPYPGKPGAASGRDGQP